LAFLYVGPPT